MNAKNIHIGYGDSATGCLLEAITNHGLPGAHAFPSRDDFTQGPISQCLEPDGLQQRIVYWQTVGDKLGFPFQPEEFYQQSMTILDELESDEITLWVGDSCHDILATGWLINYLEEKGFDWYIVKLTEVDDKDLPNQLPAVNLAMYTPDKLNDLYAYRRRLTPADKSMYQSIWQKAAQENSYYRIKKGNEIHSVNEDYYDTYIIQFLTNEFQPAAEVVGNILRGGAYQISDTTVEWNIRKLIDKGIISFQGDLNTIKSCSIKTIAVE
ncbi:MAG: DUF3658 domain-containing protein [Bacteroidota bacterium]